METKPAVASKINITGAAIAGIGAAMIPVFADPTVHAALETVSTSLPVTWAPWVTMVLGIAQVIFRTFFTGKKIEGIVKSPDDGVM